MLLQQLSMKESVKCNNKIRSNNKTRKKLRIYTMKLEKVKNVHHDINYEYEI